MYEFVWFGSLHFHELLVTLVAPSRVVEALPDDVGKVRDTQRLTDCINLAPFSGCARVRILIVVLRLHPVDSSALCATFVSAGSVERKASFGSDVLRTWQFGSDDPVAFMEGGWRS